MPRLIDPAPAQRPHLGHLARQADRDRLRRRQRPGAGPGRRGADARAGSGSRWPSSSSRTTRRTARTTSTPTGRSRWRSAPTSSGKSVDSTMYSTSSMLRTIELCLGLEPMSQFDAAARPMANAFTATPDLGSVHAPPGPGRPERQEHRDRLGGRGLDAAEPGDRGPRRRPGLQRDHLEGRQGGRLAHAAAGPLGVRPPPAPLVLRSRGFSRGSVENFCRPCMVRCAGCLRSLIPTRTTKSSLLLDCQEKCGGRHRHLRRSTSARGRWIPVAQHAPGSRRMSDDTYRGR